MASIKEISLPHGTIPTQMFGNVNLQNAIMYVNENFAEVKDGVNDAVAAANDALDAKADADHDHDEDYAALSHTHAQSEIVGLSSALDGKAELNHEHSQYLSSLPTHYHDTASVQGLDNLLQAKAEKVHTHTIADVENLTTELGVKASTSYVDQQDNAVSTSIKTIADNEIESYAADKGNATTEGKIPKDVEIAQENETTAQKNARVGTSTAYARADHKHVFETETDATKLSSLKHDGNGTSGVASFGESTKVPRLDHSHPLNYPTDKPVTSMAHDGAGEGGTALFGGTNYYADLGHSHPLNVTAIGTPADVVKSSGTASLGTATTYARTDHVHKMPSLAATDISYGSTTVGATLDSHGTRITALEARPSGGGTVKSVDSVSPDGNGNVALDALTKTNYSATLGSVYQAKSDKLTDVQSYINSDGKVLLSGISGNIGSHSGDCYVTIDTNGNLGHSKNKSFNLLQNAAFDGEGTARSNNKLITDIDIGNGIEADSTSHNLKVKAHNGIEVTSDGVSVKVKSGGGITVGSDGVALGGLSDTGFVKSEDGLFSVPSEQPITLPSDSGALYSNGTAVSVKSIGNGSSFDIASGNHDHNATYAVKSTETTASTALANAATAQQTADSKIDKSTADGFYQPKNAILTAVVSGGYYSSTNGAHDITGGAHYIAAASQKARLLGIAVGATAISARDAIGTDMVTYDGTNGIDDVIDSSGNVDASHVAFSSASGSKVVETDNNGKLVESSNTYTKFASTPSGGSFVKTSGTDGTLVESGDDVLTSASVGDGLSYDSADDELSVAVKSGGGIAIDSTSKELKIDTSASGSSTVNLGYFPAPTDEEPTGQGSSDPGDPGTLTTLWEAGGSTDATIMLVYCAVDDGGGGYELWNCKMTLSPLGTIKKIERIKGGGFSMT